MLSHSAQHMLVATWPAAFSTCFTVERADGRVARLGLHRVAAAIVGTSTRVSNHTFEHHGILLVVCNGRCARRRARWPPYVMSHSTLWPVPHQSNGMLPVVRSCATCAVLVCGLTLLPYFLPHLLWGKLPPPVRNTGVTCFLNRSRELHRVTQVPSVSPCQHRCDGCVVAPVCTSFCTGLCCVCMVVGSVWLLAG
jgi:hypothetical protein